MILHQLQLRFPPKNKKVDALCRGAGRVVRSGSQLVDPMTFL